MPQLISQVFFPVCILSFVLCTNVVATIQTGDTLRSSPEDFLILDGKIQNQKAVCTQEEERLYDVKGDETAASWKAARQLAPYNLYADELLDYAKTHPATRESLCCLTYLFIHDYENPGIRFDVVVRELLEHHREDPSLSSLAATCIWPSRFSANKTFLKQLFERSKNPLNQAAAMYYEIEMLDNCTQMQPNLPYILEDFSASGFFEAYPEQKDAYKAIGSLPLEEIRRQREHTISEFVGVSKDLRSWSIRPNTQGLNYEFFLDEKSVPFRQRVKKLAYEIDYLRAGCSPPAIFGTTTDGTDFHLEDCKGHMTILFFTLDSCGPCEARFPWIRNLLERHGQEKLKVIGIAADPSEETILSAKKSGKITWPCIWDGPSGPIAKLYHVTLYPHIFIIDPNGNILQQGAFRERQLMQLVDTAIASSPKP